MRATWARSTRLILGLRMLLTGRADFDRIFSGPAVPIPSAPALAPPESAGAARGRQDGSSLRLLSWNLLATPYVRHPRESEEDGLARAKKHIEYAAESDADVIGLQEFWSASPRFVALCARTGFESAPLGLRSNEGRRFECPRGRA